MKGNWTSEEWILALRSEDLDERDAASVELREQLTANVLTQFIRRGLSPDCVEDVVQEALLRVLNRLDTFRQESHFVTWATAVAVRTGMELIRKDYWKTQTLGDIVKEDTPDLVGIWESNEPEPEGEAERKEALAILSQAIATALTERQRKALLAEIAGLPMIKIGEELGISRNAVYKLTHDARKKLRTAPC